MTKVFGILSLLAVVVGVAASLSHRSAADPVRPKDPEAFGVLLPRLCATYPVPSIREQLAKLCQEIRTGKVDLVLIPHRIEGHQTHGIASGTLDEQGKPTIAMYLPLVDNMRLRDKDSPGLFEDDIAAVMLHERHHVIDQGGHKPGEATPGMIVEEERDCWWYTVEQLYVPMLAAGRLHGSSPHSSAMTALRAYREADGDRMSAAWTKFAILSTGIPQEVLEKSGVVTPP